MRDAVVDGRQLFENDGDDWGIRQVIDQIEQDYVGAQSWWDLHGYEGGE